MLAEQWEAIDPWDAHIDCTAAAGTSRYEHPISVQVEEPASIEVSPGEQMELLFQNNLISAGYGAHCRLSLKLKTGTIVESNDFVL
jgi:hypothetical protein